MKYSRHRKKHNRAIRSQAKSVCEPKIVSNLEVGSLKTELIINCVIRKLRFLYIALRYELSTVYLFYVIFFLL